MEFFQEVVIAPDRTLSCVQIVIFDDQVVETLENFLVKLETADPDVILRDIFANVTILQDNDGA